MITRLPVAAALAFALVCITATPAVSQAAVPFPPMDGLIQRPADFEPIPLMKPSVAESVTRECHAPHPELAWAALPRERREVDLPFMIGQLIMTSYGGRTTEDERVAETARAIAQSRIGGVLTFRDNVASSEAIARMNALFTASRPDLPPFIALDQEGGKVERMSPREGVPETPSAAQLGRRSVTRAANAYADMAAALSQAGFNVNFGPVVDLNVNRQNPIIGQVGRSYGDDPARVTRFARAFVNAHKSANMLSTLKHFPGHGSSTNDSHKGPVDISRTWSRRELAPFAALTGYKGADMVMVGHLMLEAIDPGLPASLSAAAIQDVLREAMCFSGLVVSDDLAMGAISSLWSVAEAAELFIAAGGDIALFSGAPAQADGTVKALTQRLVDRATSDPVFADKVRWAYARVVHHKLDLAQARSIARPGPEFVARAE